MVKVNSVCGLVALYMMFGFVRLWLVNIKRQLWLRGILIYTETKR